MKRILEEKINSMEPYERRIISKVYSRYFVVSPFNLLLKMSNANMDIMVELPDNNLNGKVIATNRDELMSPRKKDIKLKDLNKLYKGSSTSDIPKTNKEKNSHKINLKLKNSSFDKKNKKTNKNKYKTININKSSKSIDKK